MNIDAENGTLAAFLTIDDFYHTIPIKVTEEDFESSTNKLLASILIKILSNGEKPTKNLIKSTAKSLEINDFDEQIKSGEVIDKLVELKPTKEESLTYLKQLKKESIKKSAKSELKELYKFIDTTDEPLKNIITKVEDAVLKITTSTDFAENEAIKLSSIIERELEFFGDNQGDNGLDLGMPYWQERIGGVSNGLVHMIIATHKTGKSNIGMNAAIQLSKYMPVLYIDTEMDESLVTSRTFSILTKLPTNMLKKGFWKDPMHEDHKYFNRIQQGKEEYKKLNITYIRAAGKQVTDMLPAMRRWVIQNKAAGEGKFAQGLIIYDYVKLADFGDLQKYGLAEYQLLGLSMSALKDFCNKYKVPCLTFGQTNREDDQTINCLGASKRLGDLVDSVSLFKKKTPEMLTKDPKGSHIVRVFISRHGPATEDNEYIQFHYEKDVGTISEIGMFKFQTQPETKSKFKKKSPDTVTADQLLEDSLGANNDDPD
jgi:replicative DNA helicase